MKQTKSRQVGWNNCWACNRLFDEHKIMELFPKMGAGASKLVADLQAKGENLTEKEK